MTVVDGFNAIEKETDTTLILGTAPSVASLNQFQYYAYTYNQFWQIILKLFNVEMPHNKYPYENKIQLLHELNISLWDVLKQCSRDGSLDSSIKNESIITNDFNNFYKLHPKIKKVFFNGNKAAQLYKRHVLPDLVHTYHELPFQILPSTSPANARLTPQMKFELWKKHLRNS